MELRKNILLLLFSYLIMNIGLQFYKKRLDNQICLYNNTIIEVKENLGFLQVQNLHKNFEDMAKYKKKNNNKNLTINILKPKKKK